MGIAVPRCLCAAENCRTRIHGYRILLSGRIVVTGPPFGLRSRLDSRRIWCASQGTRVCTRGGHGVHQRRTHRA